MFGVLFLYDFGPELLMMIALLFRLSCEVQYHVRFSNIVSFF